ncbi:2-amino-4-hydroxy-6-hydroxymethyldihydropteridine diphosphokinase [Candidatus Woesearchaeota archaeon]|nr:2-amino-4-hydroxy-6-hydroxymethyldihydropteridine diphosphokinase [Candidatus Woesearchaeota archaeon]
MARVFICLGSNLSRREENVAKALDLLFEKVRMISKSSLYETKPVGYSPQPDFLNAVAEMETELSPQELLLFLLKIEQQLGRKRSIKNGPRVIDLDLLFYEDKIVNETTLVIPHPRLHERAFVLEPLCEIAPTLMHPILQKSVQQLWKEWRDQFRAKQ